MGRNGAADLQRLAILYHAHALDDGGKSILGACAVLRIIGHWMSERKRLRSRGAREDRGAG
jgi:hypothetical protein